MKSSQVLSTSSSLNSTSGGSSPAAAAATAAAVALSIASSAIFMATLARLESSSYLAMKSDFRLEDGTGPCKSRECCASPKEGCTRLCWGMMALCGLGAPEEDCSGLGGAGSLGLKAPPALLLRRTTPANSLTKAGTCSSSPPLRVLSLPFLRKAGDGPGSFFLMFAFGVGDDVVLALTSVDGKMGGLLADETPPEPGLSPTVPGLAPPPFRLAAVMALLVDTDRSPPLRLVRSVQLSTDGSETICCICGSRDDVVVAAAAGLENGETGGVRVRDTDLMISGEESTVRTEGDVDDVSGRF